MPMLEVLTSLRSESRREIPEVSASLLKLFASPGYAFFCVMVTAVPFSVASNR